MGHEQGQSGLVEDGSRGATEDGLAHAASAIGAHHQKVGGGLGGLLDQLLGDYQVDKPIHKE